MEKQFCYFFNLNEVWIHIRVAKRCPAQHLCVCSRRRRRMKRRSEKDMGERLSRGFCRMAASVTKDQDIVHRLFGRSSTKSKSVVNGLIHLRLIINDCMCVCVYYTLCRWWCEWTTTARHRHRYRLNKHWERARFVFFCYFPRWSQHCYVRTNSRFWNKFSF